MSDTNIQSLNIAISKIKVFSCFLAENVEDGLDFHRNVLNILQDNGCFT
ncbi:MAG: hypothetical protein AAF915_00845 [Cyanobacteria bacterium P01_D01_bin.50]